MFKTLLIALLPAVSAHFHLNYPYWRADSLLLATTNSSITQWNYPCAGIGQENSTNNRTQWPTNGGSLLWVSSHPDALTYVNLGLGNTVNAFNISLVPVWNETGNGTICLNHIGESVLTPLKIADGTNASIQVITISSTGASLFNCADITFNSSAKLLPSDQCQNSTGVSGSAIVNANSINSSTSASGGSSGNGTSTSKSAAPHGAVPVAALFAAAAMGVFVTL